MILFDSIRRLFQYPLQTAKVSVTFEPVCIVLKQRDHAKNREGRTQANLLSRHGHGRSKGHKYKGTM